MTLGVLTILSLSLAYAALQRGGVYQSDWNACLLAIGAVFILHRVLTRRDSVPPLDRLSQCLLLALAALAILQVLPLPLPLVQVLSPARAELALATVPVLGPVHSVPLSTTVPLTVEHLLRLAGYLLVFLLIRDIGWRAHASPWIPVVPLIILASLEATLGILQAYTGDAGTVANGTWVNRDHFAGFLEMCLPLAVMYGVSIAGRTLVPALKACALLALAALILVAILCSLSRMGLVAALTSLFVIGALALGSRWLVLASLAALSLSAFVFLPGDALIDRFAQLASTDSITSDMRVGMWTGTLHLIRAFPLFGCGLGAYESCFARYQTVAPMNTIDFAHNDYLQFMAELGIIAFLLGLAFAVRLFVRTVRTATSGDSSRDRRLVAMACAGSFTAIALHSLVDFNLYIPANAMLLAWIAGIASVKCKLPSNPS
jgi:O-antigen ligase